MQEPPFASVSTAVDPKTLAESYLKAAEGHRQRLTTLHQNEWQIAIVFWSAFAGGTVLSVANADKLMPLPFGGLTVTGLFYFVSAMAYLYGFCRTNYVSLTTERRRYLYFQNRALQQLGGSHALDQLPEKADQAPVGEPSVTSASAFRTSEVWQFKRLSTTLLLTGSLVVISYTNLRLLWETLGAREREARILEVALVLIVAGICLLLAAGPVIAKMRNKP